MKQHGRVKAVTLNSKIEEVTLDIIEFDGIDYLAEIEEDGTIDVHWDNPVFVK